MISDSKLKKRDFNIIENWFTDKELFKVLKIIISLYF